MNDKINNVLINHSLPIPELKEDKKHEKKSAFITTFYSFRMYQ